MKDADTANDEEAGIHNIHQWHVEKRMPPPNKTTSDTKVKTHYQ
jgi:hypothetical protein